MTLDWITALTKTQIQKLAEQEAIQLGLFDERDLVELESADYPGERLIACRNPIVAASNQAKREALLQETEKELEAIVAATQREKRALKGADKIGVRVGKILNKFKVGKFFDYEITDESFSRFKENRSYCFFGSFRWNLYCADFSRIGNLVGSGDCQSL